MQHFKMRLAAVAVARLLTVEMLLVIERIVKFQNFNVSSLGYVIACNNLLEHAALNFVSALILPDSLIYQINGFWRYINSRPLSL